MRIAVIGPAAIPARAGGMSRHCEELYARLAARGHEVTVYCRAAPGERWRGMRLQTVAAPRTRGWETLAYAWAAAVAAARGPFDVVHFHSVVTTSAAFVPRAARKPVVVTIHSRDWAHRKWGRSVRGFLRLSEGIAMRAASEVIAVSRTLGAELEARHRRRVEVVPNGLALPGRGDDPGVLQRLGLSAGGYVLFVGRVAPEKGVDVAATALESLPAAPPLVVAGEPRHSEAYAAALAARPGVRLVGLRQGEELASLYAHAAVVVAPSFQEGCPLSVLEAMAYGRCVVASDIPAHREVLGGAGLLFPPGDAGAAARALARALADPAEAARLGAAARKRVSAGGYDWDEVAAATEAVLVRAAGCR